MRFGDIIRLSAKNTLRSGARAVLTAAAVSIGIAAVILIASAGEGGKNAVIDEFDRLGISGLVVYKKTVQQGDSSRIDESAAEGLENSVNGVQRAMPIAVEYGSYRLRNISDSAVLFGVSGALSETMNISLLYGRLINDSDVRTKANTVLVNAETANLAYRRSNIVGKEITLRVSGREERFTVVGVIENQKSGLDALSGGQLPTVFYLPYSTLNQMSSDSGASQIAVKCMAGESEDTQRRIVRYMESHYEDAEYGVENMSSYIDLLTSVAGTVSILISLIASISLFVSGFGVMNTMLSGARERRGEIATYMAIGAKRRDIVKLFLAESTALCLTGGICGAIAGILLSLIVRLAGFEFSISIPVVIAAEIISIVCGLVFGVIPAANAAKLDIAETLKEQ